MRQLLPLVLLLVVTAAQSLSGTKGSEQGDGNDWDTTDVTGADKKVPGLNWKSILKSSKAYPHDYEWMQLSSSSARASSCADLSRLYDNIDQDLEPWTKDGIPWELQAITIKAHTTTSKGKTGIALGFYQGRAYVTQKPKLRTNLGFHASILMTYLKVMKLLETLFGSELPDVEFVLSTVDRPLTPPMAMLGNVTPEPVFRFCKTKAFPDILIPNFHSYMVDYTGGIARQVSNLNRDNPWDQRKPILIGRFTPYFRHMHPADPYTYRVGFGGRTICVNGTRTTTCEVRQHVCSWADTQSPERHGVDVSCTKRIPMVDHAKYKYLLHLDGQGLSSRFEQLLYLGGVTLREESGYYGYFYHLVKPNEHFLPVWRKTPDDIMEVLSWAKTHDADAQRIAQSAQTLALKYLGPKGRACFWLHLLRRYAKLLKYKVGPPPGTAMSSTAAPSGDVTVWSDVRSPPTSSSFMRGMVARTRIRRGTTAKNGPSTRGLSSTVNVGTAGGTVYNMSAYWKPVSEYMKEEMEPWLKMMKGRNIHFVP